MATIVTFETLREVQRREKKSEKLAELNEDFYSWVKEYFKRTEKGDSAELRNAKNIFDDIIDRREKKILNQALRTVRLRERTNTKVMASSEKELFESLIGLLGNFREKIDLNTEKFELKEMKKDAPEDIEELIEKEKETTAEYVKIKILEDVNEEIVGSDMKEYGPFKSGDIIELPSENANLFIEKGKATIV